MSDTAPIKLRKFEGREVVGTKVAITGAGDGLSDALAIEPDQFDIGQTVFVVIECGVKRIGHELVKDTNSLVRTHTLKAGVATVVPKELVIDAIESMRTKVDEAKGRAGLDFTEDGDEGEQGGGEGGE